VGEYKHKYKKTNWATYRAPVKGYEKPVTHWDWAEPKESNTIKWEDEKDWGGKSYGYEEDYCKDCWADVKYQGDLCKTCHSWYAGEYGGHAF
jgi:hypothetical protein